MSQLRGDVISEGAREEEVLEKIRCFNSYPSWPGFEAGSCVSCQPGKHQGGEERGWLEETFLLGQWELLRRMVIEGLGCSQVISTGFRVLLWLLQHLCLSEMWGGLSAAPGIPHHSLSATPAAREVLQEDQQKCCEGAGEDRECDRVALLLKTE